MTEFKLRDFQEEDVPFFVDHPKSCNWYQPRLGKTVTTCRVFTIAQPRRTLIVCPTNAMLVWKFHIEAFYKQFLPDVPYRISIVRGDAASRAEMWGFKSEDTAQAVYFIVTWNAFMIDALFLDTMFDCIVGDEYHKFLKRKGNKAFKLIKPFVHAAKRFHPLSGTPAGKGKPEQFWPVLNLCDPIKFRGYWDFVQEHGDNTQDAMGHHITVGVKDPKDFRERILDRHGVVRLRKDVAPQMPEVQRSLLPVELTPKQKEAYDEIIGKQLYWVDEHTLVVAATSMERVIRARQILACPYMLDIDDPGGALVHLADTMEEAKGEDAMGCHTVVFTPFRRALPHMERYLRSRGFGNIWQLYGSMDINDLHTSITKFQKSKGIILCSTKYAQAFSLAGPESCYHLGYEWDPDDNTQAEDRLIPQEGENPILSQYYTYNSTIDDALAEAVTTKHDRISVILDRSLHNG